MTVHWTRHCIWRQGIQARNLSLVSTLWRYLTSSTSLYQYHKRSWVLKKNTSRTVLCSWWCEGVQQVWISSVDDKSLNSWIFEEYHKGSTIIRIANFLLGVGSNNCKFAMIKIWFIMSSFACLKHSKSAQVNSFKCFLSVSNVYHSFSKLERILIIDHFKSNICWNWWNSYLQHILMPLNMLHDISWQPCIKLQLRSKQVWSNQDLSGWWFALCSISLWVQIHSTCPVGTASVKKKF